MKTHTLFGWALGALSFANAGAVFADEQAAVSLVNQKANIIENMHSKAQRALVTAAQDRVFPEYFTPGTDKHALKSRIDDVSLAVQSRFDVDEMCVIDEKGNEHSRIIGKAIAPDAELSSEEASAPFFKLAFSLQPKQVAVAPLYVSADTQRWVVAYVTPLVAGTGKPAILHFEHNLDKYRDLVNRGLSGDDRYLLMVTRDGYVFSDSRKDIPLKAKGDAEDLASYFSNIKGWRLAGIDKLSDAVSKAKEGVMRGKDADGKEYVIAYKPVEAWTIIAVEKQ